MKFDASRCSHMRLRGCVGKMVAPRGAAQVAAKKGNSRDKERRAVALFSDTGGTSRGPEVTLKGSNHSRVKDIQWGRAPADVAAQLPPDATHDAVFTQKNAEGEKWPARWGRSSGAPVQGPHYGPFR